MRIHASRHDDSNVTSRADGSAGCCMHIRLVLLPAWTAANLTKLKVGIKVIATPSKVTVIVRVIKTKLRLFCMES